MYLIWITVLDIHVFDMDYGIRYTCIFFYRNLHVLNSVIIIKTKVLTTITDFGYLVKELWLSWSKGSRDHNRFWLSC